MPWRRRRVYIDRSSTVQWKYLFWLYTSIVGAATLLVVSVVGAIQPYLANGIAVWEQWHGMFHTGTSYTGPTQWQAVCPYIAILCALYLLAASSLRRRKNTWSPYTCEPMHPTEHVRTRNGARTADEPSRALHSSARRSKSTLAHWGLCRRDPAPVLTDLSRVPKR